MNNIKEMDGEGDFKLQCSKSQGEHRKENAAVKGKHVGLLQRECKADAEL